MAYFTADAMQENSECLTGVDLARLVSGLSSDRESGSRQHLEVCSQCSEAFERIRSETESLERRLSRLTVDEIDRAEDLYRVELEETESDLEQWIGERAETLAQQTALFATPCELGQYELHALIAPGGMGEVYRATHSKLKRPVAIKVIRRNQQESQVFYENFLREIETLGQLDHPNMVSAYDAFEFDGYLFLVMELLDGESLKGIARRQAALPMADLLTIMLNLAKATQYLHSNGYLHLDIKPANVMLLKNGNSKLIDYGLAMPEVATGQSGLSIYRGTAGYMPPEQLESGVVGQWTDVYAAGKVFQFLLNHCGKPKESRGVRVERELLALIAEMTGNDPEQRIANFGVIIHRLKSLQDKLIGRTSKKLALSGRNWSLVVLVVSLLLSVVSLTIDRSGWFFAKENTRFDLKVVGDLTNSIGMPLIVLEAGEASHELRVVLNQQTTVLENNILLPSPIYIGMCEVTRAEYTAVMGETPGEFDEKGFPIDSITIEEAMEFCRLLSGMPAEMKAGRTYRLPTIDEWEYACRAGSSEAFHFGNDEWKIGQYAWYNGNSGSPHLVASKRANAWGLFDMHGNMFEYCLLGDEDCERLQDATGTKSWWGFRGGSWASHSEECFSDLVFLAEPNPESKPLRATSIGFRVVCNLIPEQELSEADAKEVNTRLHTISLDLRDEPSPAPVRTSNAVLFRESNLTHYWTPVRLKEWAEIEYQFDLPAPIESVVEFEHFAWVYNENYYPAFDPLSQGIVEVSTDGDTWHVIFQSKSGTPVIDKRTSVFPLLKGLSSFGLRAKLYASVRGKGVHFSQFLRRNIDRKPHEIKLLLRENEDSAESSIPQSE